MTVDLGQELDKAAAALLKAADGKDVKITEKLEIFKRVSDHYVNTRKGKRPLAQDEGSGRGDGTTMDELRDSIAVGKKQDEEPEYDET